MKIHQPHSEPQILIIDRTDAVITEISNAVPSLADRARTFACSEEVIHAGRHPEFGCLLLNLSSQTADPALVQQQVSNLFSWLPVVSFGRNPEIAMAVTAMRYGAFDFLPYPSEPPPIREAIEGAVAESKRRWSKSEEQRDFDSLRAKLSPREEQVYQFLLKGFENKKIAATLQISPSTVEKHRLSVVRKMRVENASQLMCQKFAATGCLTDGTPSVRPQIGNAA